MAHQKVNNLFLTPIDALDPAKVAAAQLLIKNGINVVRVTGDVPTTNQVMIVPKDKLGLQPIYDAIQAVTESQPWVVVRWEGETPSMSEAYARSRGFTDAEIELHLKPWIQKSKDLAVARIEAAKKALETATMEAAAVFESSTKEYQPLPEPAAAEQK